MFPSLVRLRVICSFIFEFRVTRVSNNGGGPNVHNTQHITVQIYPNRLRRLRENIPTNFTDALCTKQHTKPLRHLRRTSNPRGTYTHSANGGGELGLPFSTCISVGVITRSAVAVCALSLDPAHTHCEAHSLFGGNCICHSSSLRCLSPSAVDSFAPDGVLFVHLLWQLERPTQSLPATWCSSL